MATDNFNRTNETPLASPWLLTAGGSGVEWRLESNSVTVIALNTWDAEARYTGTFADNQYSQAKFTISGGSSGAGPGVCVRHNGSGSLIRAVVDAAGDVAVGKFVSGSFTSIGTRSTTWAAGDTLRIEATGQSPNIVVKVFKNGVQLGADFTGITGPNSGNPGLAYSSTVTSFTADDWDGGDLSAASVIPNVLMAPIQAS